VKIDGPRHYEGAVTPAPYVWAPSAYGGVVVGLLGRVAATRPGHSASIAAQHLTGELARGLSEGQRREHVVIYDESVETLHDLQGAPNDPSTRSPEPTPSRPLH
jgi:hypothetical protein